MPNRYNGPERRTHSDDHDTVITMLQILTDHVVNFKLHTEEDKSQFRIINRNMYIAIGAIIAFQGLPTMINIIKALHQAGGN